MVANAGPRTVTAPTPRVEITTADNANINTILTNNPGATFFFRAGTYNRTSMIIPLSNQTLVFEAGVILDGGNGNFGAMIRINNVSNVTIRGGLIRNIGTNETSLNGIGIIVQDACSGIVIEDVEITSCFKTGVVIQTTGTGGTTIRYCSIHSNGRYGFTINANQVGQPGSNNVTISRCEINNNNTRQLGTGGDAGTCKIIDARNGGLNNIQLLLNYVHDNYGFGLWVDNAEPTVTGITFAENVIEDNLHGGIFYEVGGGGCVISRNYCRGNGAGDASFPQSLYNRWQIIISCSDGSLGINTGILVERNDVDSTLTGSKEKLVGLVDFNRGEGTHVKKVTVRNNRFWCRTTSAQVGGYDDNVGTGGASTVLDDETTNVFGPNEYHVVNFTDLNWKWPSAASGNVNRDYATWQGLGFDTTSTRTDEL